MPKGYCKATGLPTNPGGRKRADYLTQYEVQPDGCWKWLGSTVGIKGYGCIRFPGGSRMAHRYFYESLVGPVPEGLVLDHLCRNRRCVNPAHLEPVISKENTMRSDIAPASINAAKTHCPKGHSYDTVWNLGDGTQARSCKTCGAEKSRVRRARIKREALCLPR